FALVPRVLAVAGIVPGPTVERARAHPRQVIRRQIVAEPVALVGRAPDIAGPRLDREADAVADAGRENPPALPLRIEDQHIRATPLAAPGGAEGVSSFPTLGRGLRH